MSELPTIQDLGGDLLAATPRQRWLTLLRPIAIVAVFCLAAWVGAWWITPFVVFLLFVAVVTAAHDVVHGSIGLGRGATDWALFALGALLLESGHAYRLTHSQHHRVFPGPDDPEGDPARMSFRRAVLYGPVFLPRLWIWAFRRAHGRPKERLWLLAEAAWTATFLLIAAGLSPQWPGLLVYAGLALSGSWVYPLLTVHLPHHDYGDTPLTQTRSCRGKFLPALFLELTYHLEHHLYPQVPSHNLPELSRRLRPVLQALESPPSKAA